MEERINALLAHGYGYMFCPPTTAEFQTAQIYLYKKILSNPDPVDAEAAMQDCESRMATILAAKNKYDRKREKEYIDKKIIPDAMIVALWEKVVENRSEAADALQTERDKIKIKYPKP